MGIGIPRHFDPGMSEAAGYFLDIDPGICQKGGVRVTKLVEATNGHSLVEAENAICYDIVRGYGLRRSLFWRRRVFFHGTKKQKTSVYRNV